LSQLKTSTYEWPVLLFQVFAEESRRKCDHLFTAKYGCPMRVEFG
jgi:hypothetical protein